MFLQTFQTWSSEVTELLEAKGREGRPTATVGLTEAAAVGEQCHTQVLLVSITWQWIMVNVHDEAGHLRQQPYAPVTNSSLKRMETSCIFIPLWMDADSSCVRLKH